MTFNASSIPSEIPEYCPLRYQEKEHRPIKCPCYNLQNCDLKLREMEEPETCKTCAKRIGCPEQVERFMTQKRLKDSCSEKVVVLEDES